MLNGLIGKKLGMTGYFDEKGNRLPVTAVEISPVVVVQKKTTNKDGYDAVQVGYNEIVSKGKIANVSKPKKGHFGTIAPHKGLKEFKPEDIEAISTGQSIDISIFEKGEYVDVIGVSKGRGFAGVIKRHGFGGGPASHGHRFHRSTGSIGNCATPARVFKNKKMPGQMGNKQVTIRGLQIVEVLADKNIILIKGAIPGCTGRAVQVMRTKKHIKKAS